jgi:ribosomal protein S11
MGKNYRTNFDLNNFLRDIRLKKQYVQNLKSKSSLLSQIREKNYKSLYPELFLTKNNFMEKNYLITYIVDICFSKSNTFLHVMDFSGKLKFFYSSGSFNYSGKSKKARYVVFRDLYRILLSKLKFLKGKPIALHLKNVGYSKSWIIKKLKKKFFIICVRSFNLYPHNGCRKRKMRRKKFKKRKKKKWLSGLKRQIVNLLSFLIVGSNPAFFKNFIYVFEV